MASAIEVGVIDYGAGNVSSVMFALERAGVEAERVSTPEEIVRCDRLILPGVGAAHEAMHALHEMNVIEAMHEAVHIKARPFLGICVGMQVLADRLTEFGETEGLGWITGEVLPLSEIVTEPVHIPHMGWSRVTLTGRGEAWKKQIGSRTDFYFAHSFAMVPKDSAVIVATAQHGGEVTAAVSSGTILATQFHPEKSQLPGIMLMEAFVDWMP